MIKKLRIVMWTGEGANQKALAQKIATEFELCGIVLNKKKPRKYTWRRVFTAVYYRLRFSAAIEAWQQLFSWYGKSYPEWPAVKFLEVERINSDETVRFTEELKPDLIVVSGTALIKEPLLSINLPVGIINLHTGLSPYIKGGPNCTNWCIATNQWHLVGNTIMWIDNGIDSGNIITTEAIDIRKADSLLEAHKCVMEHAHDLYLRAIRYLASATTPYQSVHQKTISSGKTFYNREWTAKSQRQLLRNWKKRHLASMGPAPITILLPSDRETRP